MRRLLIIMCMLLAPASALANPDGFNFVNELGVPVLGIATSHANSAAWGPNALPTPPLASGSSVDVSMDTTTNTFWDLRIAIPNGDNLYYGPYNLNKVSEIIVKSDGSALVK